MPATGSIHERCMDDVAEVLRGLQLDATSPPGPIKGVHVGTIPDEWAIAVLFPCVLVTIEGLAEEEGDGNFEETEVVYPVVVQLADSGSADSQKVRKAVLRWRRLAMNAFRRLTTLPNVPECVDVTVQPDQVIDPELPKYQYVVSGFRVLCRTFEVRPKEGAF